MSDEKQQVVLHITESFGAGTATAIMQFAAALPESSHHLLRRERDDSTAEVRHELFDSIRDLSGGVHALHAIRSAVRQIGPDIVHCHSSIGGALARLAVRSSRRRPIVYSPHCYSFQRRDLRLATRAAFAVIEHLLSWNTAVIAACSPHEATLASRLNPWRPVRYVPNASISTASASAESESQSNPMVVTTGRIGPQKDPDFFLRVVEATRRLDRDATFGWLGSGDTAAEARLEAAGVAVLGWTARPWERVPRGSVYLHSAAWEGFPFAVLEANARNLPIVARRIPSFEASPRTWVSGSPNTLARSVTALLHSDSARMANRADWASSLRANDRAHQRRALLDLYRLGRGSAA